MTRVHDSVAQAGRGRNRAPAVADSLAILPLRAFLGLVFCYSGISKVADRRFLDRHEPSSLFKTVQAVKSGSPIGGLLGPVVHHPVLFGLLIAFGELAVGIGMLAGLFLRVAAVGGSVLSLSFWLTISWQANPWFTSADLVYLCAFVPFLIGAGPARWSLDSWLAEVSLHSERPRDAATRRALVAALGVVVGASALGISALFRRRSSRRSAGGTVRLLPTAKVSVGDAVKVTDSGATFFVTQPSAGRYVALSATCPHQGCIVDFVSQADGFLCPCHQSRFSYTGKRESGPAQTGLVSYPGTDESGEIVISI